MIEFTSQKSGSVQVPLHSTQLYQTLKSNNERMLSIEDFKECLVAASLSMDGDELTEMYEKMTLGLEWLAKGEFSL